MAWSIVLIIVGLFALALPWEASLGVAIVVAVMVVIAGLARLLRGILGLGARHRVWQMVIGVIYILAGLYLFSRPGLTLLSLTLVLAMLFIAQGVLAFIGWSWLRGLPGAGWLLADGVVAIVVGILIGAHWPASAVWAVGTLLGINLLVSGVAGLMWARAPHRDEWESPARAA